MELRLGLSSGSAKDEPSGLLTRMATETVSSCERTKITDYVFGLQRAIHPPETPRNVDSKT